MDKRIIFCFLVVLLGCGFVRAMSFSNGMLNYDLGDDCVVRVDNTYEHLVDVNFFVEYNYLVLFEGDFLISDSVCNWTSNGYVYEGVTEINNIVFTQTWINHPTSPVKFSYVIENDGIVDLSNLEFNYIFENFKSGKVNYFNDRIDFGYGVFDYSDLSAFDVLELYKGNNSGIESFEGDEIILLKVDDGIGDLPIGESIELDPTLSDWKYPTASGEDYDSWVNDELGYAADGLFATTAFTNKSQDYYNFSLNIPLESTVINDIEVWVKALGTCPFEPCDPKDKVGLNIDLSWDGGNTYAEDDECTLAWGESLTWKEYDCDLWGRESWDPAELQNANFRAKGLTVSPTALVLDDGFDTMRIRINYTVSCDFNCTNLSIIQYNHNCDGANLTFIGDAGDNDANVTITEGNFTNWDYIEVRNCLVEDRTGRLMS